MQIHRRVMLKGMLAAFAGIGGGFDPREIWGQSPADRKKLALTIGLNSVNKNAYGGWAGPLQGCEPDADNYAALAKAQGFQHLGLRTPQATIQNVALHILGAAEILREGDTFLITYAGHGSQLPDGDREELDRRDETWCLHDGQLLDDELYRFWQSFQPGVRILVISDSCHSGTVARFAERSAAVQQEFERAEQAGKLQRSPPPQQPRAPYEVVPPEFPLVAAIQENEKGRAKSTIEDIQGRAAPAARAAAGNPRSGQLPEKFGDANPLFRALPEPEVDKAYAALRDYYDGRRALLRQTIVGPQQVRATGLLLAGCQDYQLSMEIGKQGLFTSCLMRALKSKPASYWELLSATARLMPVTQQPNFFKFGLERKEFYENESPFA